MNRVLDLSQHPGAYGHGGRDPIGVINILQTADVFMTVSLPGVTTTLCGRGGASNDVIKIPPLAVHVVQWLADLKVQWRVIDMDGSVFDGLDPIYFYLKHHRLRHRQDNGNFGLDGPKPITGYASSIFGTANPRVPSSANGSFVVPMSVDSRLDQMGCGPPPEKVKKINRPQIRHSSPIKMSDKLSDAKKIPTPVPRKPTVVGSGSGLKKSFEVKSGQSQSESPIQPPSGALPIKEFEISLPQKCSCMDSFGYMPYGCFCGQSKKSDQGSTNNQSGSINKDDPRSPSEVIDSLDIHAPEDTDLMGDRPSDGPSANGATPSNTFLDQNTGSKSKTPSNTFLDQKSNGGEASIKLADIPLQPGDVAVHFPPILPPNPPGRRIPPIFRWEIQIRRRPMDPALPSATERRRIFMDSIRPVKFDKSMKGKEYDAVHEFEWKTCLG